MSVVTIDGSIDNVELGRTSKKHAVIKRLTFRTDDGRTETFAKLAASREMADLLAPGLAGRFYLFSALDHKGIHGFRGSGTSLYAHPGANRTLALWLVGIGLAGLVFGLLVSNWADIRVLGSLIVSIFGVVLYVTATRAKGETRAQFRADSGYSAAAP